MTHFDRVAVMGVPMIVKPNMVTREYLKSNVGKYVNKTKGLDIFIVDIKKKYGVKQILKHDLGENPDGPSPLVLAEFATLVSDSRIISEYPDSSFSKLRKELAGHYGIEMDNISLGTGSSELIERISRAWIERGDNSLIPVPSFYKIEDIVLACGGNPVLLRLKEDDDFRWTDGVTTELTAVAKETKSKLIWLVTPNNPTGGVIPPGEIAKIAKQNDNSIVVVDEAYGEYSDGAGNPSSAASLINQGAHNVLVLRTFSKAYGLAGLRLGYCMGPTALIKILERIRLEFPINAVAERLAVVALKDRQYIIDTAAKTARNRLLVEESLSKLDNVKFFPSTTSTILVKHKTKSLYEELLKRGVLVARMEITGLEGKNYMRMTIKDVEENNKVVQAIRSLD
jgi:histidinol-phosphate aminotransferase